MISLFHRKPSNRHGQGIHFRLQVEELEPRLTMSFLVGDLAGADARGSAPAPAIRLDLVALHELGHSLGLEHDNTSAVSIMDPYYNANYNLANFDSDPAVAKLLAIYTNVNTSGWTDAADADGGLSDGDIDLTYSFMSSGLRMDGGKPVYTTSVPADWQSIITTQIHRWETVSAGKLSFAPVDEIGANAFNVLGSAQNDSRFGDIRIGTHYFDGPSKVLAHAYFPPPNGSTAAGDAHFDNAENWVSSAGAPLTRSSSSSGGSLTGGSSSSGNLKGSNLAELEITFARQQTWLTGADAAPTASTQAANTATEPLPNAASPFSLTAALQGLGNTTLQRPMWTDEDEIVTRAGNKTTTRLDSEPWHDLALDQLNSESLTDGELNR